MIIGIKDAVKLIGISIIACCAVFVCTMFLNYNIDLAAIEDEILSEAGIAMYQALVSMGKVVAAVSGGCLVVTSMIMLFFYIKNYIDTHGKELGILKALGYSGIRIAKHFWVFGFSVLTGCVFGFVLAFLYLPAFYDKQNTEGLFPDMPVTFHPLLALLLIGVPTVFFVIISVLYAWFKLNNPVLDLLREKREYKAKKHSGFLSDRKVRHSVAVFADGIGKFSKCKDMPEHKRNLCPFLVDLKRTTLRSKKTLVFFVAFSAFCFSSMVQMSMSMNDLASEDFALMTIIIGLVLAFITLFLSLTSVVKGNTKTIAMMRVFGYEHNVCCRAILGGYRLVSYIGFAIGTIYQYALLKMTVTFVFADIENVPEYNFDSQAFIITLAAFIITYEFIMYQYALRIRKLPVKSIMSE